MLGKKLSDTSKFESKSDYLLQTDKHYKIWFSLDPKEFLSVENKMRLIHFRVENPNAEIYFVYSSKILLRQTCIELKELFERISITPIDFDQDIPALLEHDYDKILYQIAQAEIEKALSGEEGNLAAASDGVRLLPGLIEKCGIYSDLDVELHFNTLAQFIALQAPVVFPCVIELEGQDIQKLSFNNEFFGFAQNPLTKKLAPEAIVSIRAAQLEVIQRYTKPAAALLAPVIRGLHTSVALDPELSAVVKWYISNHSFDKDRSIFGLRKFIKNLSVKDLCVSIYPHFFQNEHDSIDLNVLSDKEIYECLGAFLRKEFQLKNSSTVVDISDEQIAMNRLERIRSMLYKASVTHLSGPLISTAFLDTELKDFDLFKAITSDSTEEIMRFENCIKKASLKENGLSAFIKGQDVEHKGVPLSDESWTPKGAARAKQRSDEYLSAILTIQRLIRQKNEESVNKKPSDSDIHSKGASGITRFRMDNLF